MAQTAVVSNTPFLWEGTDRNGKKIKGKSLASDEATVRADLRRQGVVPTRIRKQRQSLFSGGSKITTGDIAIFSRQLATMLAAGIPLVQAFEIVGNGHENAAMQKLILSIKSDDKTARKLLAATRMRLDQPENALEALQPAVDDGDDSGLLALKAAAYSKLGDIDASVDLLEKARAKAAQKAKKKKKK